MKTISKYLSALVLASLVFAGCENFLDTVSYTESNTSNYPASEQDARQLVTGIYAALNQASYEPSAHSFIANLTMADECFGGGGQDDYEIQAYDHLLYFEPNAQLDFWTPYYSGITRANMTIANLDKVEEGLSVVGGSLFSSNGEWEYWSSTEYFICDAWYMDSFGKLKNKDHSYNGNKDNWRFVRGVRNF